MIFILNDFRGMLRNKNGCSYRFALPNHTETLMSCCHIMINYFTIKDSFMNKVLLILAVSMPVVAMGNGVVVTVNKNEMTGELTQVYVTKSVNEPDYRFQVTCEPKYGLSYNFCRKKYKHLPDVSCSTSFDYKFDNGEVKKHKWTYNTDLTKAYAAYKPFLSEVLKHNKIVTAPYPELASMPTPVYNIADFKHKIKQFGEHCQLEAAPVSPVAQPVEKKPAAGAQSHAHGDRSHSHPLPAQGKAHKHGNGEVGK